MQALIAILIMVFSTLACVRKSDSVEDITSVPEYDITKPLDSLFRTLFTKEDPGAVVVFMRGDSIVYDHSFGVASYASKRKLTDTTMMNSCSLTKTFLVAAILKLQREGKLSINDSLTKFFPSFNSDVFSKISVYHILTQTTGLPDLRPRNSNEWNMYLNQQGSTFGDGDDYLLYANEDEMIRFYETVKYTDTEPGTHFVYQEPPFMLLGAIVEIASGRPLEEYLAQEIFPSAGVEDVYFFDPDHPHPSEAHGYIPYEFIDPDASVSPDGRWVEFDYGESPFFCSRPDHGIMLNALEHVKWQRALYTGKIIPMEDVLATYSNFVPTTVPYLGYGYGTFVSHRDGFPLKPVHNSFNGGFSVIDGVYPEQEIYYTVLSNRSDWNRVELGDKIDDILRAKGWL